MIPDVAVVGGAGHVGVPLSLSLAQAGLRTLVYDRNRAALAELSAGRLPFMEAGGQDILAATLAGGLITFTDDPAKLAGVPIIVVTVGTPVDEFHNPDVTVLTSCIDQIAPWVAGGQTLILRSTVAPGVTEYLDRYLRKQGLTVGLAFCPERVVQGKAIEEIATIPQLISATSAEALQVARELFVRLSPSVIEVSPTEAEFAKLICNAFRYITFAATNQFYMMCENAGIDYVELLRKMKEGYPRMNSIPGPGFSSGPCLMKDTMQLFSYGRHSFHLGQAAMVINEGIPNFIVEQLRRRRPVQGTRVGILGMAFKAESDDIRDSLAYKLGKILRFEGAEVMYSDEYVQDSTFVTKEVLLSNVDVAIIAAPHSVYRSMQIPDGVELVDIWGHVEGNTADPRAQSVNQLHCS